jgi:hypothetical protein
LMDINIDQLRRIHEWEYLKYFLRPRKVMFLLKNVPVRKLLSTAVEVVRNICTLGKHGADKCS